jgi:hypothetical protein
MKITRKEITENVRALGGTQYQGPGYTIPMVWFTKTTKSMLVMHDRLRSKLLWSTWEDDHEGQD